MNTIILILIGMGGVLAHSLAKLQSLSKDAQVGNIPFNWLDDYVKKDIFSIALSFLSVFLWLALFGEAIKKYPAIQDYTRFSFLVFGAFGSYIIQLWLSRAKGLIRDTIDAKTNELDNLINKHTMSAYIWELSFKNEGDQVHRDSGDQSLGEYARATNGTLVATVITYEEDPKLYNIEVIAAIGKNYTIAGPVRRPKEN